MDILTAYVAALEIQREGRRQYHWQRLAEDGSYLASPKQPQKKVSWTRIFRRTLKTHSSF